MRTFAPFQIHVFRKSANRIANILTRVGRILQTLLTFNDRSMFADRPPHFPQPVVCFSKLITVCVSFLLFHCQSQIYISHQHFQKISTCLSCLAYFLTFLFVCEHSFSRLFAEGGGTTVALPPPRTQVIFTLYAEFKNNPHFALPVARLAARLHLERLTLG